MKIDSPSGGSWIWSYTYNMRNLGAKSLPVCLYVDKECLSLTRDNRDISTFLGVMVLITPCLWFLKVHLNLLVFHLLIRCCHYYW